MNAPKRYFHVSEEALEPGTQLEVGRWWTELLSRDWRTGECQGCEVCFDDYAKYVRESLFEEIRCSVNPAAPSRQECVFLWPELCCAEWFRDDARGPGSHIYEVELVGPGDMFTGDYHILNCGLELTDIRDAAQRYWQGHGTGNQEWESLWSGCAVIGDEVIESD